MSDERKIKIGILIFLLLSYGLFLIRPINLAAADLGRHLKNGEIILKTGFSGIINTNYYSYTYPDFPFINHHWGSGVIFYLVQKYLGFAGLSFFFSLVSVATLLIFFILAWRKSNFTMALFATVFMLPVLVSRTEIRPEIFSYLLAGGYYLILISFINKTSQKRLIWLLPFLECLWINLHIYFFFGLFLIGAFLVQCSWESFLKGRQIKINKDLLIVLLLSLIACLINPAGIRGLFYPAQIFQNFGYRLLENQPVWFLNKIIRYPPNLYFEIAFGVFAAGWLFNILQRRQIFWADLFISLFVSFLAWTAVRNFTLFGYFALVFTAANFKSFRLGYFTAASALLGLFFGFFMLNPVYWIGQSHFGWGLVKKNMAAVDFFRTEGLPGPIFNNYDDGGYLIFGLYPVQKVFVDNRPEAYPAIFFQQTYIPMQEDNQKWQEVDQKYHFESIFFYRYDLTPWGQTFLVNRIRDSAWAPIYVDDWFIIFLRRDEKNQKLISRFELPQSIFSVISQ